MTGGTKIRVVVVMSLLAGLVVGAAANQAVEAMFGQQFLNSALFFLSASDRATFNLVLDDRQDQPAARVLLQAFDEHGTVVANRETTLAPGASATLRVNGPGKFRFHAEIVEGSLDLTQRRAFVGSAEIFDEVTQTIRPTCSIDPFGVPPGR
jgi:hypothetical protein